MRFLYSALMYALLPFVLLRMLLRSLRAPAYRRRLMERCGFFATDFDASVPVIWVHAVSLGEVQGSAHLVESLLRDYPDHRLVLTTTTPTGSVRVMELFGDRVFHVYLPWDLPGCVARFLQRIQPRLLLLMETELWPNLLHACARRGCTQLLVNARLSETSARGYRRAATLMLPALARLDVIACQTQDDARRFISLGVDPGRVQVTGSLKFDLQLDDLMRARAEALCARLGLQDRPVWVAASTHAGEDEWVLDAFAELQRRVPDCLLVLAPRHPERFDQVDALCRSRDWRTVRRTRGAPAAGSEQVLLLDSLGELPLLFSAADVAFIGGSLVPAGGHNVLEAALWGVPVITGPHVENFRAACRLLHEAGALETVRSAGGLAVTLAGLLADSTRRREMGEAAREVLEKDRGAGQATLTIVAAVLCGQ